MATVEHLQEAFSGGEISPRLQGRVTEDIYRHGLAECTNFEPTPQGSLRRRGGSVLQSGLPSDPAVRLIPVRTSDEQDFILVLTDGELRIFSVQGGVLLSNPGSTQELILNGGFDDGTTHWSVAGVADVEGGQFHLKFVGAASYSAGSQTFTLLEPQTVLLKLDVAAVSTQSIWTGLNILLGHGGISDGSGGIGPGKPTGAYVLNQWVTPVGLPRTVQWSLSLPAGQYTLCLESAVADAGHATIVDNVSVSYALAGGSDGLSIPAPWGSDALAGVSYAEESAGNRVYLVADDVRPYYIQKSDSGWSLQPITFTDGSAPDEWGEGNWPSVVEFFQARLWLGATRSHRNTLWASRPGLPFDFSPSTTIDGTEQVLATDRITIPIASKGAIQWLRGRKNLLVGTDLGESSIAGSPVGPADYQIIEESGFGASRVRAVDMGQQVAYVSRDRRKVRIISYSLESQAHLSHDLTWVAEHITQARVAEVHHAKDPNGTVVVLLEDGTLACCTFDAPEKIAAWWTAELAGATILSAAASHGPEGSVLFLAVQRATGIFLELIPMSEAHPSRVYTDAAVMRTFDGSMATEWDVATAYDPGAQVAYQGSRYFANLPTQGTTPDTAFGPWTRMGAAEQSLTSDGKLIVSGLEHLEGLTVDVVLDGAIEEQVTVTGGRAVLARAGTHVILGVPYTSRAVTLPAAVPNGRGGLSALRAKRRWVKLFLRLFDSVLPFALGKRVAADRSPGTAMDTAEALKTGDFGGPVGGGWDTRGSATIETSDPLRCEVLALFGSIAENEV